MRKFVDEMAELVAELGRPPRLLWVDDRPSNNFYERSALEELGMKIQLSPSTDDAVALASDKRYDVIISDMRRPEMKTAGLDLLRRLRDDLKVNTPFIIYSGGFANRRRNVDVAVNAGALGCANMAADLVRLLLAALRDVVEEKRAAERQGLEDDRATSVQSQRKSHNLPWLRRRRRNGDPVA